MPTATPTEAIQNKIFLIRGQKVMLDRDLAELYQVKTGNFNKAVLRNLDRFPSDFMFRLNKKEAENLRFHFGISSWGGRRYLPYAFTEQGIAMLSGILNSKRAVQVNIAIMRTFVKLREIISTHKALAYKFEQLARKVGRHDKEIAVIFEAIRRLMEPPAEQPKRKIGFHQ